jgi:hypothetical protein
VALDQPARDRGARAMELARAVAGFAEQHDARAGEAVERGGERIVVDRRQRLGRVAQLRGQRARRGRLAARQALPLAAARMRTRRLLLAPALRADQRHEAHVAEVLLVVAPGAAAGDAQQRLRVGVADRHHQASAPRQLVEQRRRRLRPAGGDQDRVERRPLGPAQRAVAGAHLDGGGAVRLEPPARQCGQRGVPLDRADFAGDAREHGGGVARAGADLEHAVAGADPRRLDHARDDVRLRDRLPVRDRQRRVLVGEFAHPGLEERLARHLAHRREHARVAHAAPHELALDHALALERRRRALDRSDAGHGCLVVRAWAAPA